MQKNYKLSYIAKSLDLDLRLISDSGSDLLITGCAPLDSARPDQLSFLSNIKYKPLLDITKAGVVIISQDIVDLCQSNSLISSDPYLSFAKAVNLFTDPVKIASGIHASSVIDPTAKLDSSVSIGPNVVIGAGVTISSGTQVAANTIISDNVKIGKDVLIYPNVSIYHSVEIGDRVILHSGCVIGSDGFGLANDSKNGGKWIKIPQTGSVVISDDVEIGANSTVDRGAMGNTVISIGVKIDNLVQIAHNVQIGSHTAIAAKVGIAGSTKIGSHCLIGGASGINGHITIADGVMFAGMSMVTKSIDVPGLYASGMPVKPQRDWHKQVAKVNRLQKLENKVKDLEKKLK
jgi:UDP-3-O-[3-hydroxymyristoyl] glucosamine N-acyltransferase